MDASAVFDLVVGQARPALAAWMQPRRPFILAMIEEIMSEEEEEEEAAPAPAEASVGFSKEVTHNRRKSFKAFRTDASSMPDGSLVILKLEQHRGDAATWDVINEGHYTGKRDASKTPDEVLFTGSRAVAKAWAEAKLLGKEYAQKPKTPEEKLKGAHLPGPGETVTLDDGHPWATNGHFMVRADFAKKRTDWLGDKNVRDLPRAQDVDQILEDGFKGPKIVRVPGTTPSNDGKGRAWLWFSKEDDASRSQVAIGAVDAQYARYLDAGDAFQGVHPLAPIGVKLHGEPIAVVMPMRDDSAPAEVYDWIKAEKARETSEAAAGRYPAERPIADFAGVRAPEPEPEPEPAPYVAQPTERDRAAAEIRELNAEVKAHNKTATSMFQVEPIAEGTINNLHRTASDLRDLHERLAEDLVEQQQLQATSRARRKANEIADQRKAGGPGNAAAEIARDYYKMRGQGSHPSASMWAKLGDRVANGIMGLDNLNISQRDAAEMAQQFSWWAQSHNRPELGGAFEVQKIVRETLPDADVYDAVRRATSEWARPIYTILRAKLDGAIAGRDLEVATPAYNAIATMLWGFGDSDGIAVGAPQGDSFGQPGYEGLIQSIIAKRQSTPAEAWPGLHEIHNLKLPPEVAAARSGSSVTFKGPDGKPIMARVFSSFDHDRGEMRYQALPVVKANGQPYVPSEPGLSASDSDSNGNVQITRPDAYGSVDRAFQAPVTIHWYGPFTKAAFEAMDYYDRGYELCVALRARNWHEVIATKAGGTPRGKHPRPFFVVDNSNHVVRVEPE